MKLLIATIIVFFAFTVGASATSSEQPSWVSDEATTLTASCGGLRAEVIARMDYARKIHVSYVYMVNHHQANPKIVGDAQWHSYWADTYVQTIKLLKQDCTW